jgi:hypothetical protein
LRIRIAACRFDWRFRLEDDLGATLAVNADGVKVELETDYSWDSTPGMLVATRRAHPL